MALCIKPKHSHALCIEPKDCHAYIELYVCLGFMHGHGSMHVHATQSLSNA